MYISIQIYIFKYLYTYYIGFGEPRIVPFHKLEIEPASPCLHYGVQCFEGMKAYKDTAGAT